MCYYIYERTDLMSYIKLNNNPNHLSLGNLFNEIKKLSINKSSAIQTEIFCILFNIDSISDTTVNNYCTGYRTIGNNYKQIYLNYQKKYKNNPQILISTINNLLSIMSGIITNYEDISTINTNNLLIHLCQNMHTYLKNDLYVPNQYKLTYLSLLKDNNYYECITSLLFYIILEKKQPIYEEDLVNSTIEEILRNTNISVDSLREYLSLKFTEGISLIPSLKSLAKKNNPYALNELGNLEYMGLIEGTPNYESSYKYHQLASTYNHPTSCWMISHMLLNKKVGSLSPDDVNLAWQYLKKAESLNSISSLNTLGLCYLNGLNPENKKDINMAISYFEKAIKHNYIYAYNNLGKIYEEKKEYSKAFDYYIISANMEESWACNKVAEYYRKGIHVKKDISLAYKYYSIGASSPKRTLYPWNIINLVMYFYYPGIPSINIPKDLKKSLSLLEKINDFIIGQSLITTISYELYLCTLEKEYLDTTIKYINILNNNPIITKEFKDKVNTTLNNLSNKITIPDNSLH